jgi:hypothetical protein
MTATAATAATEATATTAATSATPTSVRRASAPSSRWLLRIPDFRDQDFRICKTILKKGFESNPDLSDPNPQIPQKRSLTVVTIHAKRINAQKSIKNWKEKICAKIRPNLRPGNTS